MVRFALWSDVQQAASLCIDDLTSIKRLTQIIQHAKRYLDEPQRDEDIAIWEHIVQKATAKVVALTQPVPIGESHVRRYHRH